MRESPGLLLFALSLHAPLAAQEGPDWLRREQLLRIEVAGPAAFEQAFRPTNLGVLLGDDTAQLRAVLFAPVMGVMAGLDQQLGGGALAKATSMLGAYRGRVRVGVELEVEVQEGQRPYPAATGGIALSPDGNTDLEALAELLQVLIPVPAQDLTLGETTFQGRRLPDAFVVGPQIEDGWLTLYLSDRGPDSIARFLDRSGAEVEPATVPFHLHLDLARSVELWKQVEVRPNDMESFFLKGLGVEALDRLDLSLRPLGPHLALETEVRLRPGEPRGLIGALAGVGLEGAPALWETLPEDSLLSWAGRMHLAEAMERFWEMIAGLFGGAEGAAKMRAELAREFGFDPFDEVLAHIDRDAALMTHLHPTGVASVVLVATLADPDAFAAGWAKMGQGPFAHAERQEVDGIDVIIEEHGGPVLAATGKRVGVAFGPDAVDRLLSALSAQPSPRSPAYRRLSRLAPEGHHGTFSFSLADALGREEAATLIGIGMRELVELVLQGLIPVLRENEIDRVHAFTGTSKDRWSLRLLW